MALVTYPRIGSFGLNIRPASGNQIYIYEAGTTTPKTTYSIPAMTAGYEQTHPVTADARGVFPAIYTTGLYKIIVKDSLGAEIYSDDNQTGNEGGLQWTGTFSSTTNISNYPASGDQGDVYLVTETFVLAAASGSHQLVDGDFIVANKNGAAALDADWNILQGGQHLLDEDDMVSNSAIIAPSQQSTKAYINAQDTAHANLTAAHGATGAVVGTTNTQTLTNKTLTSPTITGTVNVSGTVSGLLPVAIGRVDKLGTLDSSIGVSAVTRIGVGNYSIELDTYVSSYLKMVVNATVIATPSYNCTVLPNSTILNKFSVLTFDENNAATDVDFLFSVFFVP